MVGTAWFHLIQAVTYKMGIIHLTDEVAKVQRGKIVCPKSQKLINSRTRT